MDDLVLLYEILRDLPDGDHVLRMERKGDRRFAVIVDKQGRALLRLAVPERGK
jgi:hypothetical protein